MNVLRKRLGLHSLVDLNGLLGGVKYHEAVRALGDVNFDPVAKLDVDDIVLVIIQLLQKLYTGKQKRRPLSA